MKIIEKDKFNILEANEGYVLRDVNDVYTIPYIGDDGTEIEGHIPYYFKKAYVPKSLTLEETEKLYVEILEGVVEKHE